MIGVPAYDALPTPAAVIKPSAIISQALPTPPPGAVAYSPGSPAASTETDDIDALLGGVAPSKPPSEPPEKSRSRPSAPLFDFSPREKGGSDRPEPPTTNRCAKCGTTNAAHIRFCLSCGNQLRSSLQPSGPASVRPALTEPAAANPPEPAPPSHRPPPPADQPIAPMPVLGLGNVPAAMTIRICSRCRGVCDSSAQFCKFCGASLVDAEKSSRPSEAPRQVIDLSRPARSAPRVTDEGPTDKAPPVAPRPPVAVQAQDPLRSMTTFGRLVVIAKDGGEGQSYPIGERLDIGRSEGDVLVPDDGYLSPRHARLSWRGGLFLRDLGSTNGVYLRLASKDRKKGERPGSSTEGRSTVAVKLEDQDLILLGQQVIRFELVRDAEEGLGPASQHGTLVFGTPIAPRYARLSLRTVEGVTRDVYYLGKRETILGRESGDIIFAEDPFLSRRHAAINVMEDGKKRAFSLSDFGSSNGTFLQIRGEAPLEGGDEFRVGQQLFRVELTA